LRRLKPPPDPHYHHRFPAEIISHAVWLYHVFSLSLRDVELLLAERGVVVSYETIRRWCKKFGQTFASRLRRRRPRPGDKWHMDEMFIRIEGVQHYLGVPWIRTASCSTFSFSRGGMAKPRSASFDGCCWAFNMSLA
jgi:putative transposase